MLEVIPLHGGSIVAHAHACGSRDYATTQENSDADTYASVNFSVAGPSVILASLKQPSGHLLAIESRSSGGVPPGIAASVTSLDFVSAIGMYIGRVVAGEYALIVDHQLEGDSVNGGKVAERCKLTAVALDGASLAK
eukprot:5874313-Amphidinium_carterae.1